MSANHSHHTDPQQPLLHYLTECIEVAIDKTPLHVDTPMAATIVFERLQRALFLVGIPTHVIAVNSPTAGKVVVGLRVNSEEGGIIGVGRHGTQTALDMLQAFVPGAEISSEVLPPIRCAIAATQYIRQQKIHTLIKTPLVLPEPPQEIVQHDFLNLVRVLQDILGVCHEQATHIRSKPPSGIAVHAGQQVLRKMGVETEIDAVDMVHGNTSMQAFALRYPWRGNKYLMGPSNTYTWVHMAQMLPPKSTAELSRGMGPLAIKTALDAQFLRWPEHLDLMDRVNAVLEAKTLDGATAVARSVRVRRV